MALRLVLDTNVVLDIFHWHNPGATPILAAARVGDVSLVTNTACLMELRHVVHRPHGKFVLRNSWSFPRKRESTVGLAIMQLDAMALRRNWIPAYAGMTVLQRVSARTNLPCHRPRLGLTEDAANEIVGSYLVLATRVDGAAALQPLIILPRCKDQDDQKFLELARDARAELLVTRDKALLTLARKKFALAGLRIVRPDEAVAMLVRTPGWH